MILLDHCTPRRYLRLVKEWGYDTALLTEYLPPDSPDTAVIALAQKLDAVLLTVDLDFANILDYPPKNYAGIVVIRYEVDEEQALDATLKQALDDLYRHQLRETLVIIAPTRYRIRR